MKKTSLVVFFLIAFTLLLSLLFTPGCDLAPSGTDPTPTPVRNTSGWTQMTIGTSKDLVSVWGTAANKVYAVTADGEIWLYSGTSWALFDQITPENGSTLTINCIWISSDNYIFVGGREPGGPNLNGIVRWRSGTGTTWSKKSLTEEVLKIWGPTDRTSVYLTEKGGNIAHFDGSNWMYMTSGVTAPLYCIFGLNSTNIYAGGENVALRYVPTPTPPTWTAMTISPSDVSNPGLKTIWGYTGTSNSWWCGGPEFSGISTDGTSWTMGSIQHLTLNGIWGKADGSLIFGVGSYTSTDNLTIEHNILQYNNMKPNSWEWQTGNPPANDKLLYGIWGINTTTTTDFFAVGEDGTVLHYHQ